MMLGGYGDQSVLFSRGSITAAVMERMATARALSLAAGQAVSRLAAERDRREPWPHKGPREQNTPKDLAVTEADCGACDTAAHASGPSLRANGYLATILVVDEDPITALILCELLQETGFRVVSVSSVWDALRCVETGHFNLMITEVALPGAFSGVELVIYARSINPALKSLFISGYGPVVDDPEQDDFVPKPFRPRELLGCAFELLYRRLPVVRQKCRNAELAQIEAKIASLRPSRQRRSRNRTKLRRAARFSPALATPARTGTQGD
jgi:CheY-like chemotaxis protein